MARVVIATYMVRYPLGGMLSWALQWALGFSRLGHEVLLIEKANYEQACFDPVSGQMTDDGANGFVLVASLLARFGLKGILAFVDVKGTLYGFEVADLRNQIEAADILIDIGNHGAWQDEAKRAGLCTAMVDGEPGYSQIRAEKSGRGLPKFDYYFSNGANVGTPECIAPSLGVSWRHVFNPVILDIYPPQGDFTSPRFSTVMNWRSHEPISYLGKIYGQKDIEFEKYIGLPGRCEAEFEIAAAGQIPESRLSRHGWRVVDAHQQTASFDSYRDFIQNSAAEFSVCKNVFVEMQTGWFSDRSAAYLSSGRPVILQDTGFSKHLPCGDGLFAVTNLEEAVEAVKCIRENYTYHSSAARRVAQNYLSHERVLNDFLTTMTK